MADRHNRDIDRPLAPLPEPLRVRCADSHAHLEIVTNAEPDSQAVADVFAEAAMGGIDRGVQVGCSSNSCVMPPVSRLLCHVSCLTSSVSCLLSHISHSVSASELNYR